METLVKLDSLGNGAVLERFDAELDKVLANIADPNTKAEAVREITVKLRIKPSAQRNHASLEIVTASKLAPYNSVSSAAYIGRKNDKLVLVENNPQQLGLDGENGVVPLSAAAKGGK